MDGREPMSEVARDLAARLRGERPAVLMHPPIPATDRLPLLDVAISTLAEATEADIVRLGLHLVSALVRDDGWEPVLARRFLDAVTRLPVVPHGRAGNLARDVLSAGAAAGATGRGAAPGAARAILELAPFDEHRESRPMLDMDGYTRFHRLALARLASPEAERAELVAARDRLSGDPIALIELDAVASLDEDSRLDVAALWPYPDTDRAALAQRRAAAERLGAHAAFDLAMAAVLQAVADRLSAIHGGRVEYRADKAFSRAEVDAAVRAACVGSVNGRTWVLDLVPPIMQAVAVAPIPAKTVPSQSMIECLANEVARFPLRETVNAVEVAAATTRHGGVAWKLGRTLKVVRRNLPRA